MAQENIFLLIVTITVNLLCKIKYTMHNLAKIKYHNRFF